LITALFLTSCHILLRNIIKLGRVSDISAKIQIFVKSEIRTTPTFVDQNALQDRFTISQQQTNQASVWRLKPRLYAHIYTPGGANHISSGENQEGGIYF
jgi:hypothetical protein